MLCEVLRLDYFVSDLIPVFVNKCSVNNTKMIISPLINLVLDSMPSVTRMQNQFHRHLQKLPGNISRQSETV